LILEISVVVDKAAKKENDNLIILGAKMENSFPFSDGVVKSFR
jgi:hypothetical protein